MIIFIKMGKQTDVKGLLPVFLLKK